LMAAQVEVVGPESGGGDLRSGRVARSGDRVTTSDEAGQRPAPRGVNGGEERVAHWVQHQWDALWHSAAHQLLRAKLYGFLPFEVVYRRAAQGQFEGLIEVERLIDYHPRDARLLVQGDHIVGFSYENVARTGVAFG